MDAESETLIPTIGGGFDVTRSLRGEGFDASENGTGREAPLVPVHRDLAPTLTSNYGKQPDSSDTSSGPMLVPVAFAQNQRDEVRVMDKAGALSAEPGMKQQTYIAQPYTLAIRGRGDSHNLEYRQDGTANALLTPNGGRGGIGVGAVAQPVAIRTAQTSSNGWGINTEGTAYTLDQAQGQAVAFHPTQDPISSTEVCHAIGTGSGQGCATAAVLAPTLTASNDPSRSPQSSEVTAQVAAVVQATAAVALSESGDIASTLRTGGNDHADVYNSVATAMQVRRLTPVECERLQGFPDGYTAIPWRGKLADQCPDGPRYKALGNSWAVPVVRWIGARIARVLA